MDERHCRQFSEDDVHVPVKATTATVADCPPAEMSDSELGAEERMARQAVNMIDASDQPPLDEFLRFSQLTVAVFAMCCAACSYGYNIISGDIQNRYGYNFRDMSNISTCGMVFAYFLLPYGTILDYFGPRPLYTLACVLFPIAALLFGLTFQGVIEGSVVRFCVYNAMLSLGSQLFDLATVIALLSIFPTRKGWVIALLKTMMGLAQAIIAAIKVGFFATNTANYFYFLIALVAVIGVAVQLLIRLPPYHLTGWEEKRMSPEKKAKRLATRAVYLTQEPPMWRFYFGIAIIIVLVAYLPMTSAVGAFARASIRSDSSRIFAIVACILTSLLLLMVVPFPYLDRLTTRKPKHQQAAEAEAAADGEPIADDESDTIVRTEVETDVDYIAPQYQTTFLQSCLTPELWCILWTMFCGVGAEFVIIFNARYFFAALTGEVPDPTVNALLTVINGAGSALGRLLMCAFEEYTQNRPAEKRVPITLAFFIPTICIIVALVLFLVLPGRSLLLAYTVAALGNGFCASVAILVLRTLYAKDPAKHYNFGFNALWIAAILLNRLLFGEWYAIQAEKLGVRMCLSKRCVMMPLIVMLGINVTAFLSDIYLHFAYRRYARKVLAERRRIKEGAALGGHGEEPSTPDAVGKSHPAALADLAAGSDSKGSSAVSHHSLRDGIAD